KNIQFTDTSFSTSGNTITEWYWNFGDPSVLSDTSNLENPVYVYSDTGSFQINLIVTTDVGCKQSLVKTIHVNPTPVVNLGADTTICAGNFLSSAVSNTGGNSYLWNDNSSNDSLTVTTSGPYWLLVTNTYGCTASDTTNITISGFAPTAYFSNSTPCKSRTMNFTDGSTPPLGNTITSWNWNFGNDLALDDTSILQHPQYTYPDTGMYTVTLVVTTNAGCKQSFSRNLHVAPVPLVNYSNTIACKNADTQFTNGSSSPGYAPLSYSWNFGDGGISAAMDPAHLFSQQLTYAVKLVTTNSAGCKDSITKIVTVKAEVTANFTNSTPCTNAPVSFQDNSVVPIPNTAHIRTWTIGASTFNGLTVTQSFPTAGTYPVQLTVTGANGCNSSITKNIEVKLPPVAQFALNSICMNDTLKPIDNSIAQNGSINSWNWQLNNTTFSTAQAPSYLPSAPGSYTAELVISDSFGCKDSTNKTINIYNIPVADFSTNPSTLFFTDSLISFSPLNTNALNYTWNIEGTNQMSTSGITHVFDTAGIQPVILTVTDLNGCSNSKSITILLRDYFLDLGISDVRSVYGSDGYISIEADLVNLGTIPVSSFEISVHVTDASSIKETWTGTPSPSGLYTYAFNSKLKQLKNNPNYITCVTIESVNSMNDANSSNNNLCIAKGSNHSTVSDPFPNPGNDHTVLPIQLNKESEITIEIIDLLGQKLAEPQSMQLQSGLSLVNIPLSLLNQGHYLLKITIGDTVFMKKITKVN
ncbi:MAG TPA: PKD domain-containing protein, partial [Bacteroidia bacterium]